jgi:hypothetical protein
MTSQPDSRRPAATWIVVGLVAALAIVATVLGVNLLADLPTGTAPTATESPVASATSGPSGTPLASSSASSTPTEPSAPGWSDTGSMIGARAGHTATRLLDGTVLVAGGSTGASGAVLTSAELYDPVTGSWSDTGNMKEGRSSHSATLLLDGQVLVVGGISNISGSDVFLASAELYDPTARSWTSAGGLVAPGLWNSVTLLDGRVLVVGSSSVGSLPPTEVYDPRTTTWTVVGNMTEARSGYTATRLPDGRVLVAGGYGAGWLASAELYDLATGVWIATGSMVNPHSGHTATLLRDGTVLVAGGATEVTFNSDATASAEIYNPRSERWAGTASMSLARYDHTAFLLLDGRVLVMGGTAPASAEIYDPGRASWTATEGMTTSRGLSTATLLLDGRVLVTGGSDGMDSTATAELYDPGGVLP